MPRRKPGGSASRRSPAKSKAQSTTKGSAPFCWFRVARSGGGPKAQCAQARRFEEPQRHDQQLGPARRENRLRFSRPKNSTVQSSLQFSAPCPPHCGSAFAPPVPLGTRKMGVSTAKRRPRQFCLNWLTANRQNMPFKRAGDGVLRPVLCPRAREILSKRASAF